MGNLGVPRGFGEREEAGFPVMSKTCSEAISEEINVTKCNIRKDWFDHAGGFCEEAVGEKAEKVVYGWPPGLAP